MEIFTLVGMSPIVLKAMGSITGKTDPITEDSSFQVCATAEEFGR